MELVHVCERKTKLASDEKRDVDGDIQTDDPDMSEHDLKPIVSVVTLLTHMLKIPHQCSQRNLFFHTV